ncbi:helix-turn-helix domain-containing protein [Actinokineospora diospyrosa]|uniref:Helix-turn-helix domain-containing protein n=1 Tax=Actinokineospora diospyrosa TaxID=103728 RepID=A0ABT1IGX5_9PSEU|nr:helix-turn-helix transcriptional regulator [Actinokineospora diospyrosa]MCP2271818.1 Helix-turn-helix domain-containing protein [Actinokineospora diospyrosa]
MPPEQTRRKRMVGRYMEALRKRHDPALIPERAAALADTSRTTISRLENGQQLPNKHLFAALLTVYGATPEERAEAVALWNHAKQGTVTVEHAADMPSKYVAFRRDEADAVAEFTINYSAIPGLLQTADYAMAISDDLGGDDTRRSRMTEDRQARQRLLGASRPLHTHAILSEAVLHFAVGGPTVLAEQLAHLVAAASSGTATIQVVPFVAGSFGTMNGPLTILRFDDDSHVVYLEYPAGGELVDSPSDVSRFVRMFENVRGIALTPEESTAFIQRTLDVIKE